MEPLTLDQIMAAAKRPETTTVPVPEWGGAVQIRPFTRAESTAMREACTVTKYDDDGKATKEVDSKALDKALLMQGMVSPKLTEESYQELQNRMGAGTDRVVTAIVKASGMGGLTPAEAADVRNSFPAPSGPDDGEAAGVRAGEPAGDDGQAAPEGT